MSSDDESINNAVEISDKEQENEILEIEEGQDQEEQTEEVQRDETAEGEGGDGEDGDKKTVKPKTVRRPQPKLNAETLKGPRGIAALESYFQHVKFKGKGYENEDLNTIMKTYEYWCHRLFPKFPFDTCIEKLEKLGNKKAVLTHIKRIRYDLLFEDKPIVDDSDEEPNVEGFVDIQPDDINQQQNLAFDQLLAPSAPAPINTPTELTEEQLERIRLNKERAERLKQERLRKIRDKAEERLEVSSQVPGTSGLQQEIRSEELEGIGSTQDDIFSQESYSSALESNKNNQGDSDAEEDREPIFDHESNVKGKTSINRSMVKKRSRITVRSDSETSENENIENEALLDNGVSGRMNPLDVDEDSSDSIFSKRKRKKHDSIMDSDDDQIIDDIAKKQKNRSRTESPESMSIDNNAKRSQENFINGNTNDQTVGDIGKKQKNGSRTESMSIDNDARRNQENVIDDSTDGQSVGDIGKNQKNGTRTETLESMSVNKGASDDENTAENTSFKKRPKQNALLDTDDSDQEMEQENIASEKNNGLEETEGRTNGLDDNKNNQEMNKNGTHLNDGNNSIGLSKNSVQKDLLAVVESAETTVSEVANSKSSQDKNI